MKTFEEALKKMKQEVEKLDKNLPVVIGNMYISYDVYCPHCKYMIDDMIDREWWGKYIVQDEGPNGYWEVVCPECGGDFEINGFEH